MPEKRATMRGPSSATFVLLQTMSVCARYVLPSLLDFAMRNPQVTRFREQIVPGAGGWCSKSASDRAAICRSTLRPSTESWRSIRRKSSSRWRVVS